MEVQSPRNNSISISFEDGSECYDEDAESGSSNGNPDISVESNNLSERENVENENPSGSMGKRVVSEKEEEEEFIDVVNYFNDLTNDEAVVSNEIQHSETSGLKSPANGTTAICRRRTRSCYQSATSPKRVSGLPSRRRTSEIKEREAKKNISYVQTDIDEHGNLIKKRKVPPNNIPKRDDKDPFKVYDVILESTPELVVLSEEILEHQREVTGRRKPLHWMRFRDYQIKIPEKCTEAIRGNEYGSLKLPVQAPGMPTRKFSDRDMKKYGMGDQQWQVQEILKTAKSKDRYVIYAGWASTTGNIGNVSELQESAPEMIADCNTKSAIEKLLPQCPNMTFHIKKPDSIYWCYSDLSYFHTVRNEMEGLPPVRYIVIGKKSETLVNRFPKYAYTNQNLVTDRALLDCYKNRNGRNILEILKENRKIESVRKEYRKVKRACRSKGCKCFERFKQCYAKKSWIPYDEEGRISYEECERRLIIECSDTCGCTLKDCPTRQLQRGSTVEMVIYYEGSGKGFGVRAGRDILAGEFIAEYSGLVRNDEEVETGNSYLFNVDILAESYNMVIDATDYGNPARYINHSCDPNSVFCEVHSREKEEDVLVPRVGIFAIKDIKKGEEILLSYWSLTKVTSAQLGYCPKTACYCGSERCRKYIPLF